MVNRLFGVIRDSLKMKEMSWDPERTVELYYQISRGFIDSPDLRVTWLENLGAYHAKVNETNSDYSFPTLMYWYSYKIPYGIECSNLIVVIP